MYITLHKFLHASNLNLLIETNLNYFHVFVTLLVCVICIYVLGNLGHILNLLKYDLFAKGYNKIPCFTIILQVLIPLYF